MSNKMGKKLLKKRALLLDELATLPPMLHGSWVERFWYAPGLLVDAEAASDTVLGTIWLSTKTGSNVKDMCRIHKSSPPRWGGESIAEFVKSSIRSHRST